MPRPLAPIRTSFFETYSDDDPTELLDHQAAVLDNLYRDGGHLTRRGGSRALADALYPDRAHDGLAWFRLGATDVLFAAHNGSVVDWLFPIPAHELTNAAGKLTAGQGTSFAFLDGKVYAADGTRPMVRLTATRADQAMVDDVGSGLAVADAGAAGVLLASTTYTYRVAFLSADGQPGKASAAVLFTRPAATGQNRITLPLCPAGQDCSGRRIYRLPQGSTTYRVVAAVADNTTTTYNDNVSDANLTLANDGEPNLTNDRMPSCGILIEHEGRLLGAANLTETYGEQTLFVTNYLQPWFSPAAPDPEDPRQGTRIRLQGPAAGKITGIASHGDKAWAFTAGALYVLVGDEPLDYGLKHFANHGCVSQRTIQSLQDRLVWLAPDGIYSAAEGQGIGRISDPVRNTLAALTPAELAQCHSVVSDQRYTLLWPGGCLWVDFKYRPFVWGTNSGSAWRLDTSAESVYQGTARPRLFGSLAGHARVVELETGTDDDGTAIATVHESGASDLGNPGREKRLHLLGVSWKLSEGQATVTLKRGSGEAIQTETQDLSEPDVTGGTICRLLTECVEQARDERFSLRVEYAGDADAYQILATDGFWSLCT